MPASIGEVPRALGEFHPDVLRPREVRRLLAGLGIRPLRRLGQHFLVDRNILRILIEAAELTSQDSVLEIGPGLGALTAAIVPRVRRLVAVEKDARLHAYLVEQFAATPGVTLVLGDALRVNLDPWLAGGLTKVVSNLPYAVGSRILVRLLRASHPPWDLVVTVQREVAERVMATPGASSYGLLSLWVQLDYEVELLKIVQPSCFWPRPEVTSAILRARRRPHPVAPELRIALHAVSKAVFSRRRKQVAVGLSEAVGWGEGQHEVTSAWLQAEGIDPRVRPQDLSVEQWLRIARRHVVLFGTSAARLGNPSLGRPVPQERA